MPSDVPSTPSSSLSRTPGRDVLVAASLANLVGFRLWAAMLDPATTYFLEEPRAWQAYAGTIAVVAALAAIGAGTAFLHRRAPAWGKRTIEAGFFLGVAIALHGSRLQIADLAGMPQGENEEGPIGKTVIAISTVFFLLAFLPERFRAPVRAKTYAALLVLSPFVAITVGQTSLLAWRAVDGTASKRIAARPAAPRSTRLLAAIPATSGDAAAVPAKPATRVVIVLLDEWDSFLSFEDRPEGIELPEIDRLIGESVYLPAAQPPGRLTELVMPSLFTGRKVVHTTDAGESDRRLFFEDGKTELFSETTTFFTRAKEQQRNAAIAGWYHPYCRILGDDLVDCSARAIRPEMKGMSVAQAAHRQATVLLESFPHGKKLRRAIGARSITKTPLAWHDESWKVIHARARALAVDPSLDVVLAHYPVPHPPGIWDAKTDSFSATGTYEGNIELADRLVGELRADLENAQLWDQTAFIVLADHPKRGKGLIPLPSPRLADGEIRPVPFVIHMPGGGAAIREERKLSTTILHDLVLDLMQGTVDTTEELQTWLTRHSS